MKLLIIGANGKTGRVLVQRAVAHGHQVTALVHHPPRHPLSCAMILQGDAGDPALLDTAVTGQDAVIDTIGTRKPFLKTTLETDTARNLIRAMQHHHVRRLIAISSIGVGDSIANVNLLFRLLIPLFFRGAMPDKEGMEAQVRSSDLDWTIVRPAGLTDAPATGEIHRISPSSRRHVFRVARADVAAFMLSQLEQTTSFRQTIAIATH
jgi:putative NADH-flavin reductase